MYFRFRFSGRFLGRFPFWLCSLSLYYCSRCRLAEIFRNNRIFGNVWDYQISIYTMRFICSNAFCRFWSFGKVFKVQFDSGQTNVRFSRWICLFQNNFTACPLVTKRVPIAYSSWCLVVKRSRVKYRSSATKLLRDQRHARSPFLSHIYFIQ